MLKMPKTETTSRELESWRFGNGIDRVRSLVWLARSRPIAEISIT